MIFKLFVLAAVSVIGVHSQINLGQLFEDDNGTRSVQAPDQFQVIMETNVDRGAACPLVLNVTRSLAPNSTDIFWSMVTSSPAVFEQSAFYSVVAGSYAEFGISGDPTRNSLESTKTIEYDTPQMPNLRGTVSLKTLPYQTLGLQAVINLHDNSMFDAVKMAPFAKVIAHPCAPFHRILGTAVQHPCLVQKMCSVADP